MVADATALLPTSTTNFATPPRVLSLPHLLNLRFEIPNLSLQFPYAPLPILLCAEDLPLESADDAWLTVVTAHGFVISIPLVGTLWIWFGIAVRSTTSGGFLRRSPSRLFITVWLHVVGSFFQPGHPSTPAFFSSFLVFPPPLPPHTLLNPYRVHIVKGLICPESSQIV